MQDIKVIMGFNPQTRTFRAKNIPKCLLIRYNGRSLNYNLITDFSVGSTHNKPYSQSIAEIESSSGVHSYKIN